VGRCRSSPARRFGTEAFSDGGSLSYLFVWIVS